MALSSRPMRQCCKLGNCSAICLRRMKTKTISHGSRHLRSWGKRNYRELKHSDLEALAHRREQDRDLEPEEWPWRPPCWCCSFNYEFDDKLRVMLSGTRGSSAFTGLAAHDDGLSQEKALEDEASGIGDLDDSEGMDDEDIDGFLNRLQGHLEQIMEPGTEPVEVLHCTKEELDKLHSIFTAYAWWASPSTLMEVLTRVLALEPFWLRSPLTWNPPAGDQGLDSLLRHLFARQPVPFVLLSREAWTEWSWKWRLWVVLLGRGLSVRRAGLRFGWWCHSKLLKHLFEAPFRFDHPAYSCQWADARRRGANVEIANELVDGKNFFHDPTAPTEKDPSAFTQDIDRPEGRARYFAALEWLVRNQDQIPVARVNDILQWAAHRRAEQTRLNQGEFTWKGRTSASVMRDVDAYMAEMQAAILAAQQAQTRQVWNTQGWDWGQTEERGSVWTIMELTRAEALAEEGRAMRHCVVLYAPSCVAGQCAIFSVRRNGTRALTVEIGLPGREIRQARGVCNREADPSEMLVVRAWLATLPPAS